MHIQVSNLSKTFGAQEILNDISFTISNGERVALLGKNGSGKTTLFKILIGQEEIDGGTTVISPKEAKIGYLPQAITASELDFLSAGQKTKKSLRQLLAQKPDTLFLDEPTNHLDWEGLDWLEKIVNGFKGPILMVSHDRRFLDNTVDTILELENGHLKVYGGNYTFYKYQKLIEQAAYMRTYKEQQRQVARIKREIVSKRQKEEVSNRNTAPIRDRDKFAAFFFADRSSRKFGKQIQSLEQRLRRFEEIDKPSPNWKLKALFKPAVESSQTVVQLKSVSKSFGGRGVFNNLSFTISKKQRVALTGVNGSGKTTVIKLILGELQPDSGEVKLGNNVQVGYLSQEHEELSGEQIVLDELVSERIDKTEAYRLLHRFLLTPEKINQPVKLLSSGEKAKLLLAKIMTKGANLIILDEPTNHLDIPSREIVEESLANYPGTLLVVSHDRYFLERIGITDYYIISDGKLDRL